MNIIYVSWHIFCQFRINLISDSVVICARLADSQADFNNVQNFCVIELGLPFIPVSENIDSQMTQVILQLIDTSNPSKRRKNCFPGFVKVTFFLGGVVSNDSVSLAS